MNKIIENEPARIGTFEQAGAVIAPVIDPWAWWMKAKANPSEIGKSIPLHHEPHQGYYRVRYGKTSPWLPVAIFYPEGSTELVAYRDGKEVHADDVWTHCCRYPVSYEAYMDALAGKGWPDDEKVVAEQIKPRDAVPGDNSGEVDQTETIKDQIEAALARRSAYAKIGDDETAAKALSLRNRLNELSNEADKAREKEKAPHWEKCKSIDAKWQPLVKRAKAGANEVRDAISAWETKKLQEQRKREAEAEKARIAAEQAAREQQGETAVLDAPAPAPAPVEVAPQASIKPTYGKAASVSVRTVVAEITDWPALAVYMSGHPEMQELLRKLAQRALDAGRTGIPGITTTEEAKVR